MKVLSVVGARPQFVKLAPMAEAFAEAGVEHVIVHTGQHYDPALSDAFFADLRIPDPDVNLGIGSGSHGVQTGKMLAALDGVLHEFTPDLVLVYGDTNSTLAGALSAAKMHVPTAHLEAGLRSFNRRMPEEVNRVLSDHAADLLLAPTQTAMGNLATEGLAQRSVLVGDVMADVCLRVGNALSGAPLELRGECLVEGSYYLATLHRQENTDDPQRLLSLVRALQDLDTTVILVVHPRLAARARHLGLELGRGAVRPFPPLDYPTMVRLTQGALKVLTDSGGLQKEAYLLGTPCVTLRTETEWVETLNGGWNVLCPGGVGLKDSLATSVEGIRRPFFGEGRAARVAVASIRGFLGG